MFCLNSSDFLVLRFIKTIETLTEKLDFPEEGESSSRTIINSRLYFSANANITNVIETKNLSKNSLEKFEVDLSLPKEAFDLANSTKVVFFLYRKTSFFKLKKDTKLWIRGYIIAASLQGKKIANLNTPVILRYSKSKNNINVSKPLCVFWNFKYNLNMGGWSEDGCTFQRNDKDKYDECHCNHLTHFAMLLYSKLHDVCTHNLLLYNEVNDCFEMLSLMFRYPA